MEDGKVVGVSICGRHRRDCSEGWNAEIHEGEKFSNLINLLFFFIIIVDG